MIVRFLRSSVIAAAILALSAGSAAASHIPFQPSFVVRPGSLVPYSPDVSASGSNAVVGWSQYANGPVPDSVWTRQKVGSTWQAPVRLFANAANAARELSVFSSPTRHYAVWSEDVAGGGSRVYLASAPFGGGWTTPILVSSNAGASVVHRPSIVVSGAISVLAYGSTPSASDYDETVVTRYRVGTGAWTSATMPGGTRKRIRLAATSSRVLIAWQTKADTIRVRVGSILGGGSSFAWASTSTTLGPGYDPIVVASGTRAVLAYYGDGGWIHRRTSTNAGATWSAASKVILAQSPISDTTWPEYLYDGAMDGTHVVLTGVAADNSTFRATSTNSGASWTTEAASLQAGDDRQVAYSTIGSRKLHEAWLRVQGQLGPYPLRYARQV